MEKVTCLLSKWKLINETCMDQGQFMVGLMHLVRTPMHFIPNYKYWGLYNLRNTINNVRRVLNMNPMHPPCIINNLKIMLKRKNLI
jgi:hypothetical protein